MNDISLYFQNILKNEAMPVLRERFSMFQSIYIETEGDAPSANNKVTVALPQDFGEADDRAPGDTFSNTALTSNFVEIELKHNIYKQWTVPEEHLKTMLRKPVLDSSIAAGIKSVSNKAAKLLLELYKEVPYVSGAAGTTPGTVDDVADAMHVLDVNLADTEDLWMQVDPKANTALVKLLSKPSNAGDNATLHSGSFPDILGVRYDSTQLLGSKVKHVAGDIAAATSIVNDGIFAAGVTAVDLVDSGASTLTGSFAEGDLVSFAGHDTMYVVTEAVTAATNAVTVELYPALTEEVADAEVLTLVGDHTPNLMYQTEAFAAAFRTTDVSQLLSADNSGMNSIVVSDPVTGIPLTIQLFYDNAVNAWTWRVSVLCGMKTYRPELAVRILG